MDEMFERVDPETVTAGEFMARLTQEALDNDGVAHLVQRVLNQETNEEVVVVLHVGIAAVMTPEDFEDVVNEASEATAEANDPVVQ